MKHLKLPRNHLVAFVACLLMFCAAIPSAAFAAPNYATARTQFENGDLQGTQKSLESLLLPKPKISGKELEEAQKLYGISLYLQNKKSAAESVFRAVLNNNPNARLKAEDLLDPQIETFFETIRSKNKSGNHKNGANKSSAQQQPRIKLPVAPPNASILVLMCGKKKASVFVDGLYVGACNNPITLEPGRREVTVTSEGYVDAVKSFDLKAGQTLGFVVNMRLYSNTDDEKNPVFGEKIYDDDVDVDNLQQPLPGPKKTGLDGALIQLQPMKDDAPPEVFLQPQPYSHRNAEQPVVPQRSYLVALMPFGAGQFQNGEPTKGALSLAAQLTGLGIWGYTSFKVSLFQAKVDKDPTAYDSTTVSKYKKNMQLLGNVALGATGFVYLISAFDALVNIRNPAVVSIQKESRVRVAITPAGNAALGYEVSF